VALPEFGHTRTQKLGHDNRRSKVDIECSLKLFDRKVLSVPPAGSPAFDTSKSTWPLR
jgi:hypothetical protein